MSSEVRRHHNNNKTSASGNAGNTISYNWLFLSIFTLVIAVLFAAFWHDTANLFTFRRLFGSSTRAARSVTTLSASSSIAAGVSTKAKVNSELGGPSSSDMKTPVYFLSHGGVRYSYPICSNRLDVLQYVLICILLQPSIMYDLEHPAYKKLAEIGREVTTKAKPRAVVVFSAHWQGGRDTIYVNTAEMTDLIYEYA